MIILFGTKQTQKLIGMTKAYRCGRCGNVNPWQVIKITSWFTLFFLPIFPFSSHYIERCPICGGYNDLSKEQAMQYADHQQ